MATPEDVIEQSQHFRDAAKDCLVQLGPDAFVVTTTVEQADLLRAHLANVAVVARVPLGDLLHLDVKDGQQEVITRVLDSLREEIRVLEATTSDAQAVAAAAEAAVAEKPAPVKRGPGRPRKTQD